MTTRILPIPMGSGINPQNYYTKDEVNALIADFITNTVDDLTNYYLKSETYTQTEINSLIGQITSFEVVATLPTENIKTNVVYLLGPIGTGADKYEEWIYSNSQWVKIGETSIDLSNYVTVNQLNTALGFYTPTQQLAAVATGGKLSDLSDTAVSTPSNGQVLTYNSTSQKWENAAAGGGNVVELTQAQYDALQNPDANTTYVITDSTPIDMGDYASQTDMETVQTALATKADKQSVTANTNTNQFPYWNAEGVITGASSSSIYSQNLNLNGSNSSIYRPSNSSIGPIYGPTTAGSANQIPVSSGSGAPTWQNLSTLTGGLKFWLGTTAEYTALSPNYDSSTLYVISD